MHVTRTAALLAATIVLLLPAGAGAAAPQAVSTPAHRDSGHWVYPGQRPVGDAALTDFLAFGRRFWQARNVTPCADPTTWIVGDLGPDVAMTSDPVTCEVWVVADFLADAHARGRLDRLDGQMALCGAAMHEDGHLGWLAMPRWDGTRWVDGHAASGVMRADGGDVNHVDFVVRRRRGVRAVGNGPCGLLLAARWNSRTAARAAGIVARHGRRRARH